MNVIRRQSPAIVFLGDVAIMTFSLWGALLIRYQNIPTKALWQTNIFPFAVVFLVSITVFIIAGLYEKVTSHMKSQMYSIIMGAQIANIAIAISLFYLVQFFGVTPKTILFLYLVLSTGLLFVWRAMSHHGIISHKPNTIILIGETNEVAEIKNELERNSSYNMTVGQVYDIAVVDEEVLQTIFETVDVGKDIIIAGDSSNEKIGAILSRYYDRVISQRFFIDIHALYEDLFDRVPVASINYLWLTDHNRNYKVFYGIAKRIMDIVLSLPVFLVSLILYPFVALCIFLEDGGPVFITQERVGFRGKTIKLCKFRSMSANDTGVWLTEKTNTNKVTKIGYVIRKTRIDELPQLVNVLIGSISLIGPRPDIKGLGDKLVAEIPYYMTRYMVKPGLSGWAQIQYKPPQSVEETKLRLSYDLFYIKNRSMFLDILIALRTIKTLLSRTGM